VLGLLLLGLIGFLAMQIIGNLAPGPTPSPSIAQFELPDYEGRPVVAVREDLAERGLERAPEQQEANDEFDRNTVIRTIPPAGSVVSPGDPIILVVSLGPDTVPVPSLIGQTEEQAIQTLRSVGLEVGNVSGEPNAAPDGRVIRSQPPAGTDVERGSQVDLVLSSGPTPSPTPQPTPSPTPTPTPTPSPTASPTPPL
jgi:eukaryotic-like serine/threonine-protein kinase